MMKVKYLKHGYSTFTDKEPHWISALKLVEKKGYGKPVRVVVRDLETNNILMNVSQWMYSKLIERGYVKET